VAEFGGGVDGVDPPGETDASGGWGWGCVGVVAVLVSGGVVLRGALGSSQRADVRRVLEFVYTPRAERRGQIVVFLRVVRFLRHVVKPIWIVVCVGHAGARGHASCADGEVCDGEGWFGGVDEGVTGYVCEC
jgi:hypothetical protein